MVPHFLLQIFVFVAIFWFVFHVVRDALKVGFHLNAAVFLFFFFSAFFRLFLLFLVLFLRVFHAQNLFLVIDLLRNVFFTFTFSRPSTVFVVGELHVLTVTGTFTVSVVLGTAETFLTKTAEDGGQHFG